MEHICHHPWVGIDISPQGEFKPCCKYKNVIATSLSEYTNSNELALLKEQFLAGKKPEACKRCWDDEDAGLPSKRQLDWKYVFRKQTPNLNKLKVLSIPFGNSCNLACRTCSSYASSGWIAESKKLQDIKIYKHQRFYQDTIFIDAIKDMCSEVIHVEFPGGEPFLAGIDEHLSFLDRLISQDAGSISLHYMTNATIFPSQEFWNRWRNFKKVDIQLSIDGVSNQFEYIRHPGNWEQVQQNIKEFQAHANDNIQLSVSHTVSIFNIFYLEEFLVWCLQNKLGKPYIGVVSDPTYYSIKVFPKHIKDKLTEKLSRSYLKNVVQYMNSEDLSEEFSNTISMINKLDELRNQDFKIVFSEFVNFLEESRCPI